MLRQCAAESLESAQLPPISGAVLFFYYDDVRAAVDWYEKKLGFSKVFDEGWVAIFSLTSGCSIGLVNATDGALRPTPRSDKGALVAIETEDVEGWFDRLSRNPEIQMAKPLGAGAKGKAEVFQIVDPGGYIVEFFRWLDRSGQ